MIKSTSSTNATTVTNIQEKQSVLKHEESARLCTGGLLYSLLILLDCVMVGNETFFDVEIKNATGMVGWKSDNWSNLHLG